MLALTLVAGCSTPRVIRETPTAGISEAASPTATATAEPTVTSASPVASPNADDSAYRIDRVVFSTRIDDNDVPVAETTVVSESARQIYLCVHVSGIRPGAQFRAYWLENDQVIGQSDAIAIETQGRPTWVALEYRPPFPLKPDADYAVELLIENERVDRYVFRAGRGDPAKAIAEAAFASGFNAAGKPVGVRTSFPADESELTLRARVSRMVDLTGWTFATLWFRGDVLIQQLAPEPGEDPRLLTFTLRPAGELVPGEYAVALLLNGVETRRVPFEVVPAGTEIGEPTDSPTMPAETNASVDAVVLSDRVDPRTSAPTGEEVTKLDAPEQTTAELWLAISVSQLSREDVVEVRVNESGSIYANERLPRRTVDDGWIATPLALNVPAVADGAVEYIITVLLNGNRTETWTVLINPIRS